MRHRIVSISALASRSWLASGICRSAQGAGGKAAIEAAGIEVETGFLEEAAAGLYEDFFASLGYVAGGKLQQAGYASTGTTFWGAGLAAIILLPVFPFVIGDTSLQRTAGHVVIGNVRHVPALRMRQSGQD